MQKNRRLQLDHQSPPVDFKALIAELSERFSITEIAEAVNHGESTIRAWRDGHAPGYNGGQMLVSLYLQELRRPPPKVINNTVVH